MELRDASNQLLAKASREVRIVDESSQPVTLDKVEPGNGVSGIEPNDFIALYFNRPVDISKLSVAVRETVHGKTYINRDAPGLSFLQARGYQLEEVHRDQQPVSGALSILPGSSSEFLSFGGFGLQRSGLCDC